MGVRAIQDVSEIVRDLPEVPTRFALRRWLGRYAEVNVTSGPLVRVWIEAIEGPLRQDRAAVTDWGRRRMATMLAGARARRRGGRGRDPDGHRRGLRLQNPDEGRARRLPDVDRAWVRGCRAHRSRIDPEGSRRHMASRELQRLLENIRAAGSFEGDLMTMRKMTSRAPAYPKPDDITWEPVDAAGVPAEWVIPDDCEPGRALVYLHGGGYATGTLESHSRPVLPPRSRDPRPPARGGLPTGARASLPRRGGRCRHGLSLRHLGRLRAGGRSRSAATRQGAAWRSPPSSRSASWAIRCPGPRSA